MRHIFCGCFLPQGCSGQSAYSISQHELQAWWCDSMISSSQNVKVKRLITMFHTHDVWDEGQKLDNHYLHLLNNYILPKVYFSKIFV